MFKQLIINLLFMVFTCGAAAQIAAIKSPFQKKAMPASQSHFFNAFQKQINAAIPSLGSFAVWRHNSIMYQHYFHGASATTPFNIKSITKSICSAIAGIIKNKGLLPDLNTPVVNILTEYAPRVYPPDVWYREDRLWHDSLRRIMTIKDILTMQTGLAWSDFGPTVDAFLLSPDPVKYTMEIPYDEAPGYTFNYCSGASATFEAVLERVLKSDLKLFADSNLFTPAGISVNSWQTDPTGRYCGASELFLTMPDLMKFGVLYLHNGIANGKQLIPQSWIKESWQAHATLNKWPVLPNANGYGYYWWRRKSNGYQAYIASGAGGQLICIIPSLDMVLVTTCFMNERNRGRPEIKLLHHYIDRVVKELVRVQ